MKRTVPHTHFRRGKRVLVILRNGTHYVDTYLRKSDDDRTVRFKEHGDVLVRTIRSISIYKQHERGKNTHE